MFENKVLRSMLRPKAEEVTGGFSQFCGREVYNLNSLSNIIRSIK
jgi:hypothetical protein